MYLYSSYWLVCIWDIGKQIISTMPRFEGMRTSPGTRTKVAPPLFNFDNQILWQLRHQKTDRQTYAFGNHSHFPFKVSNSRHTLQNTRNVDHRLAPHNIWKATAGHSHRPTQQLTNQHLGCQWGSRHLSHMNNIKHLGAPLAPLPK